MVQSKLTLLALAGTALAGVVRREDHEVDHLNPEELSFPPPPPNWVTPSPYHFEGTIPSPTSLVQAPSEHSREPHSTYLPSGLSSHFPQPTEEALPPFITTFPGAGEFAHTEDSAKPTSVSPAFSQPALPGASYDGPPPNFSEPVKPEEPQLNSSPRVSQAYSSHQSVPSLHADTTYASPTKLPSFTDGHLSTSEPVYVKPTEPWDDLDAAKPTSYPEIPSWISHLPPPSEITPSPKTSDKGHDTTPSSFPEAYQGPPPLPSGSLPSEPHGSSPAVPHPTPSPGESEEQPHPIPSEYASGKPRGSESTSPAAVSSTPAPHGSYQEPSPLSLGSSRPTGESGPPGGPHDITPTAESYQAPSPTFTVSGEYSEPKSSSPAGPHYITPAAESYQAPSPTSSVSGEYSEPKSSSPAGPHYITPAAESYQALSPTSSVSGEYSEPKSSSPAGPHYITPAAESYQAPSPTSSVCGEYSEPKSSSPAGPHYITPASESYQAPSPTSIVSGEYSQPKGSSPAGLPQISPPPTESHHEYSPPPFESTSTEPYYYKSSSSKYYQLPSPSSIQSSHPSDADHPTEPATPHEGPSPHYGAAPPISCTYEKHPHNGESNLPPFIPPSELGEVPHGLAPPHAIPTPEKTSDTLTDAYVPHISKPEPTVTEAPSISHIAVPINMPPNCTEVHSEPAIPSPTGGKPQSQGSTGEHHTYGSPSNIHPTEASSLAKQPSATRPALEPSKIGVPKAAESAVHYSSLAPGSTVPITVLVGAVSTLVFFSLLL